MSEHILIAYYSWSGNTRIIAEKIHEISGGVIHEIEPQKPYPGDFNMVVNQAKKEIQAGFKPELKSKIKNINSYDTVFIGSPNWWSTIAPPVVSFLAKLDSTGKSIIPFCSHGGAGNGRILHDISRLCPHSTIFDCLGIYKRGTNTLGSEITEWLEHSKIQI